MSNKQLTVVEWLSKTLRHNSVNIFNGSIMDQAKNLEQVFQQAKEIDSEEKLIDYSDGYTDGFKRALELVELTVEEHKTIVYDRTLEKIHSRIKELKG
jgi:hypothetical protein